MATSDSPLSVPNVTLAVAIPEGGEPPVAGSPSISSVTDNGGTLTIAGSNFGAKAQAAPVLADYVGVAFENGTANTVQASAADGDVIPTSRWDSEPNAIWETRTSTAKIRTSRSLRHAGLSRSYFADGDKGWFGNPLAYGGPNPPAGKNPLYVAWWQRARYNTVRLHGVVPDAAPSGTFTKDEPIVCDGRSGVYAGNGTFEGGDFHFLDFDVGATAAFFKGKTVTGQTSGATMVYPLSTRGGSGTGYFSPGSKLARIWDNPSGHSGDIDNNIRCSIAAHDHYIGLAGVVGKFVSNNDSASRLPYDRNQWMFIECYMDLAAGKWRMWINSELFAENDFTPDEYGDPNFSPTLSLLGTDGGPMLPQETDISEIYLDKTPQRVYLGDAPTRSAVSHWELQRPTDWADGSVTVAKNEGALSGTKWVYVVGPDGSINEQGVSA